MCLYPKLIKNKKYIANKKNGGIIPPLPFTEINGKMVEDIRVLEVPVKCGKCIECKRQKAREWQVRLHEEIKNDKNGIFVTLTFSNESILELSEKVWKIDKLDGYERDNEIGKVAVRRFLERWRKKYKKSIKHWLVTELGHNGTENIHLHGIIWTKENPKEIERIWKYGYTWLSTDNKGYVNGKTINYIVKYIHKVDEKHQEYKSIVLTSPGIGKDYEKTYNAKKNKYNTKNTKETYTMPNGTEIGLPIYYRNKIYNEDEREKLWQEKLDKEERYILGEKVKTDNGDEKYYSMLGFARAKNKRLGYGNDEINWDRRRYERERRNINFKKRTKDAKFLGRGKKR